jgi:hypothetical protein
MQTIDEVLDFLIEVKVRDEVLPFHSDAPLDYGFSVLNRGLSLN